MKVLVALALAALSLCVSAQMPGPPEVAARSYLLLDVTANQMLAAQDIDTPVEPASLTKLMTAYLVFDALKAGRIDLKQTMSVSQRAWKVAGPRVFIDPQMQVPVQDLVLGMVVQNGNDAAMALAEGVGGTAEQFVRMMNEQAKALGMRGTRYRNPYGQVEAGHTSTARDLGILATRLVADFPQYLGWYAVKQYRYAATPASIGSNRNRLLYRDPTVDGLATSHTDSAGYCMVASARRDFANLVTAGATPGTPAASGSRRLVAILLGAQSDEARANEAQKLLNWGYTAFEAVKLYDANQPVITPPVWQGSAPTVGLGRTQSLVVAVPSGMAARLRTQVLRNDPLVAPIALGQPLATLRVTADQQRLVDVPLEALAPVAQAGIFGRAWDAIRLWIR